MKLIKSEWHSTEIRYEAEITIDDLEELFPDMDEKERMELMQRLEDGDEEAIEEVDDANFSTGCYDWEYLDDDCWTMRKGGYDITYAVKEE
jgi:hypothetical protein